MRNIRVFHEHIKLTILALQVFQNDNEKFTVVKMLSPLGLDLIYSDMW